MVQWNSSHPPSNAAVLELGVVAVTSGRFSVKTSAISGWLGGVVTGFVVYADWDAGEQQGETWCGVVAIGDAVATGGL